MREASSAGRHTRIEVTTFIIVAVAGLLYVKWFPYYGRALVAAAHRSIGQSMLMGEAPHPPAPSLEAAVAYALAYVKAIWHERWCSEACS